MSTTPAANLLDTYQRAEELLISGDLRQSADLCKQLLDADPEFAHAYHLMAALFRSTGNLDKALEFARMALEREPTVPAFYMQLGQVWYARQQWQEASEAFEAAHRLEKDNPFHLMLWADAYVQQGRFDEALVLFAQARAIKDISDIDEHEGICLLAKGDETAAETLFDRVIERRPDHYWGYVHKGKLLAARQQDQLAETYFAKALKLKPDAYEALHDTALIHDRRGRSETAMHYAVQAIQCHPRAFASHVLLGSVLLGQNHLGPAEEVFRQAHTLRPDSVYILHLLKSTLLLQNKNAEATSLFENLLKAKPNDASYQYMCAMLQGMNKEVPKDYIARFFDEYAERFDHHQQQISNRTPHRLADAVRLLPEIAGKTNLSLLDLGCGTGLAAAALAPITQVRVGVDLSGRMLDKARSRQLYEQLFSIDMTEFTLASDRRFDLVIASDALSYTASLQPFFSNARQVLSPSSILAFTVEKGKHAEPFALQVSGRYSHSPAYVLNLAAEHGYTLLKHQDLMLRHEQHQPVEGVLFIFKKSPTH